MFLYQWFIGAYNVAAFVLLRFEDFMFVHRNLYYSGHILLVANAIIVTLLPKVSRKKTPTKIDADTASSSSSNKKTD